MRSAWLAGKLKRLRLINFWLNHLVINILLRFDGKRMGKLGVELILVITNSIALQICRTNNHWSGWLLCSGGSKSCSADVRLHLAISFCATLHSVTTTWWVASYILYITWSRCRTVYMEIRSTIRFILFNRTVTSHQQRFLDLERKDDDGTRSSTNHRFSSVLSAVHRLTSWVRWCNFH